jgi:hypothetical protein
MTPTTVAAVVASALALAWAISLERKRRAALALYWSRGCAGREWRAAFPSATKGDIREYLYLVVDAFGFERSRALQLSPSDTVLGLYRACYPDPSAPDALETELLVGTLSKKYRGVKLGTLPDTVTFGELFSIVTGERPNTSLERGREG